ncbi:hypothetical protein CTAYLR_008559 [Chrysophaeum taylorii]|uniref:Transketolase C-terminal domain-containing protein n=1 Tax=Chrysophaeum taylorii TaxID=2483200 RepID=A0AAD7U6S1_9STRA|nr:hypothetical protein CTAYLR_008559 [Chrysophaeum taylorii]
MVAGRVVGVVVIALGAWALVVPSGSEGRQQRRRRRPVVRSTSEFPMGGTTGYYTGPASTPLLDAVKIPADMKQLSSGELKQLAHELRWEVIRSVSKTGGHLGSSLGVIELTVALHYVFEAPEDRIIWDVSHQCYPHKILTGRRSRMDTLRQQGGLSGFQKRAESEYDCFGAGHSSTSISAALGMAIGKDQKRKSRNHCIAIIGDVLPIGKGRVVKRHRAGGARKVALLALGTRLAAALEAAKDLEDRHADLSVTVADARFMKPLDLDLVRALAAENDVLVTIEENSVLGFGDYVLHFLALEGFLDSGDLKVRPMVLPDTFIEAATQFQQYDQAGLNAKHVVGTVNKLIDRAKVPAI